MVVVVQAAGLLASLRELLAGFISTEARLAITGIVLLAAGVVAVAVTPWLVRLTGRLFSERVLEAERVPDEVGEYDWLVPTTLVVRTLQAAVGLVAAIAVLSVWGFVDTATAIVTAMGAAAPTMGRVLVTLLLVFAAIVGTNLLESRLEAFAESSRHINQHQEGVAFRVVQVVVIIAAAMSTLWVWQFDLGGLLVGAGFLGIVVGMAARQTLGSFIAGFVIMFSRPFELGDWVAIDGEEGVVTDITIINTRLRSVDGERIILPNDRVSNAVITNRTREGRLRLSVDVGVDYDVDVEWATELATEAAGSVDRILDVPAPQTVPTSFGDSAVVLSVRFWIDNPSARKRALATAEVVRAIKESFDREGLKIPFPQRELSGRSEEGGLAVRNEAGEGVGEPVDAPVEE